MPEGFSTDSYPKPALPVSPLDIAGKLGGLQQQSQQIQSGALTIDKQKLDLVSQHMAIANHELSILANDPDLDQKKVTDTLNRIAKTTNMPAPVYQKMHEEYAAAGNDPAKLKATVDLNLRRGMSVAEQLNNQYSSPTTIQNNQQITPVGISQQKGTVTPLNVAPSLRPQLQMQPGPELPVATPAGNQALGPQGSRLPQGSPAPVSALPVGARNAAAAQANPAGFEAQNGYKPTGPMTSQAPMFEEGKKQLAEAQNVANAKLTALKPAEMAFDMMKNLRSGPGTGAYNQAVAFLKANNIIPTDTKNDATAIYQEVNKYMNDYLSRRGGSTDAAREQLMKSSPDLTSQISPALMKLTRTAIAQDKMEASMPGAFEENDMSKFGNHKSIYPSSLDQRAFEINQMEPKERQDLIKEMRKKAADGKADGLRFKKSLEIAYKQGLVNAP